MKSAIELAMEKADGAVDGDDYVKLTPEQVQAVDQVTKEYEATPRWCWYGWRGQVDRRSRICG